mgnify:CR=1 FL=1
MFDIDAKITFKVVKLKKKLEIQIKGKVKRKDYNDDLKCTCKSYRLSVVFFQRMWKASLNVKWKCSRLDDLGYLTI